MMAEDDGIVVDDRDPPGLMPVQFPSSVNIEDITLTTHGLKEDWI